MNKPLLISLAVVLAIAAVAVNFYVFANRLAVQPATQVDIPAQVEQTKVGYCFYRAASGSQITVKTDYVDCFLQGFDGDLWCEQLGLSKCFLPPGLTIPAETPSTQPPHTPVEPDVVPVTPSQPVDPHQVSDDPNFIGPPGQVANPKFICTLPDGTQEAIKADTSDRKRRNSFIRQCSRDRDGTITYVQ